MEHRIVAHPDDVPVDAIPGQARGPLGFRDYTVTGTQVALAIAARPYYYTLPLAIAKEFSMTNFTDVLAAHIFNRIGARVDGFEQYTIGERVLFVPQCRREYIYATAREAPLLDIDTVQLVGYVPVATDENHSELTRGYTYEGIVLVDDEDLTPEEWTRIDKSTYSLLYTKATQPITEV